jgi:microcin C transport system ATP-binding protein
VVEHGDTEAIFDRPSTDYTKALIAAAFNLKPIEVGTIS